MTLKDTINGPVWMIWVVFALFAVTGAVLLSGHGANLIAGFSTATEEERSRYNTRRLCRVVGGGLALIAVTVLIMGIWMDVLPASFAYVILGVIAAVAAAVLILANTFCKNDRSKTGD